ncbi:MAG TPA: glycosyltransferase family 1 protein [Bryobacteraceae bacterium]|nr:glycosyltransferase family 1 protein [Bryobacteraceae bacterium]
MRPLRIGVNALYMIPGGVGGTEIYLHALLAALAEIDACNQYFVFTNRETGPGLAPVQSNFHNVPQRVHAAIRPARIVWEQTALPLTVARLRLDALLNPGFTAPVYCPCPAVTVFHDMQHKRHPEHFRWFDLPFWRLLLYASAHRAALLLADSEASRADVLRYYRLPEDRVRLARLGVDPAFFSLARAPEKLLLTVSTLHPHKGLDALLHAFALFHLEQPDFRLVIAGLRGFHAESVERLRRDLELNSAVDLTGWIPRTQLYDLYTRAAAFLYPSTFEGFGMPVLEALAAGIPTACSDIEPLSSMAGGAALRFRPGDVEAIHAAMLRLVSDDALRRHLADEGPRRAARFSWTATARATLDAIVEAARKESPAP